MPRKPPGQAARGGFTVMEMLVLLALVAIVAAAAGPSVVSMLDRSRVHATGESLVNLAQAIEDFRKDVGAAPRMLDQLSRPITTADQNSCSVNYTTGNVNRWKGPYVSQTFTTSGPTTPLGAILNTMIRTSVSTLAIVLPQVDANDIIDLDDDVDASSGAGDGALQWANFFPPPEFISAFYFVPINGC